MECEKFGLKTFVSERMTLSGIIDDSDATECVTQVDAGSLKARAARTALDMVAMLNRITRVDERVKLTIDEVFSRWFIEITIRDVSRRVKSRPMDDARIKNDNA